MKHTKERENDGEDQTEESRLKKRKSRVQKKNWMLCASMLASSLWNDVESQLKIFSLLELNLQLTT